MVLISLRNHPPFEIRFSEAIQLPALRSLLRISEAVLRANYFDEVLEVLAEQTLAALNAASCSISRWEGHHDAVRTLINVGELGPGEQRWPHDELYFVADDALVTGLLQHGVPYAIAIDDDDVDPAEAEWLRAMGKQSELAVPVMHGGTMWGELWVTGVGGRRFGSDDVQFLQAIAAYAAMAIGRSELFSETWCFAHQDPLTGLSNRRELARIFGDTDWALARPAVVVCDLDGFKDINDRRGHPAGDALLRSVAHILDEFASAYDGATAFRLGGDEFCVVLPGLTSTDAERFAHEVSHGVHRALGGEVTLSWGAAPFEPFAASGDELLEAADAALLEAKRLGPGRFNVGAVRASEGAAADDRLHAHSPPRRRGADPLLDRVVQSLDRQQRPVDVVDALEMLAFQVHNSVDAAAWSISASTDDHRSVQTVRGIHSVRDPVSGLSVVRRIDATSAFSLADYPATALTMASGSAFVAAVDLDGSDPAEVALLVRLGYQAVLGVGVAATDRSYLLEIYSNTGHDELTAIASLVRVLAHYCASRATRRP